MIHLNLTVQQAQSMPEPVLDWLVPHMHVNDTEWIMRVRLGGHPSVTPSAPVEPPAPVTPRVVEKTPEGVRVTIPPATTAGLDQRNSPFWAQGANPAALAAASINVPVVPSAIPPMVATAPPAAPTGLNSAMFHPVQQAAPPAPAAPSAAPVSGSGRTAAHMRDVIFPQIMAAKDIGTCRQILEAAGISHISHVTDANVDQVAAAVQQVTGVVV
jgi:hypothetical protein